MKIAVMSDIHLGRGDQADRRGGQDEALLRLLDYLEAHFDVIVLLGDIWELLTPKWPIFSSRELKIVQAAHPQIAHRFAQPPYHYIVGNHDRAVETLENVSKELILTVNQTQILFTHGHQFDVWAHQLRYIGECVVWISGWAARLGTQALTHFFDWAHNLITGTSKEHQLGTLEQRLIQYSQENKAQITVMGHTHLPGITQHNEHILVNSGHCLGDALHFVGIDSQSAEITVYQVNPSRTHPISLKDLKVIDHTSISHLTPKEEP